jgi:hypothetical protein
MFLIMPQGGLCNRMRSIDAAMHLSIKTGVELTVQWHKDPGLNCAFESLFEIPSVIKKIQTIDYTGHFSQLRKTLSKRMNRLRYDVCMYERDLAKFLINNGDLVELMQRGNTCIASCMRFFPSDKHFDLFKPVEQLQKIIDENIGNAGDYVGVHVRRADHLVAIERSPINLFVTAMQHEIQKDQDVKFFLSTDCDETEAYLHDLFPRRLVTHKKTSFDRSQESAILDAVIDLYCLGSAKKIIGSYSSSFSETAAELNNVKLEFIDSKTML